MGVATVGAGVVLGLEALGAKNTYNAGPTQASFTYANGLATATDVLLIGGGVLTVLGGVLAFLPSAASAPSPVPVGAAQTVRVSLEPTVRGAILRGTF